MPHRPPGLKQRPKVKVTNFSRRESRQARGYGRQHDLMRTIVLREEPLCRACLGKSPERIMPSVIADHIVPKAEGGSDDRENYQGLCDPCHKAKTAKESARARMRKLRDN